MSDDLYRILQVDPAADSEVIEAAYRRLARKYHPDVSRAPDADARMRELNAAYEVLRNPDQRSLYDGRRGSAARLTRDCQRHQERAAVAWCTCGAGLCGQCAVRFWPASCGPCVLRWARSRQVAAIVSPMAVAMLALAIAGPATWVAAAMTDLPRLVIAGMPVAPAPAAALACMAVAALLVARCLWRLGRLREVVAEALA